MKDFPYNPVKALICKTIGHDFLAYDFGVDKCVRCCKEKHHAASDLDILAPDLMAHIRAKEKP